MLDSTRIRDKLKRYARSLRLAGPKMQNMASERDTVHLFRHSFACIPRQSISINPYDIYHTHMYSQMYIHWSLCAYMGGLAPLHAYNDENPARISSIIPWKLLFVDATRLRSIWVRDWWGICLTYEAFRLQGRSDIRLARRYNKNILHRAARVIGRGSRGSRTSWALM